MDSVIELKSNLKNLKKNLNRLLVVFERELNKFNDMGSEAVAIFFGRVNGFGIKVFCDEAQEKLINTNKIIKYQDELYKLFLAMDEAGLSVKEEFKFRKVSGAGNLMSSSFVDGEEFLENRYLSKDDSIDSIFMNFVNNDNNIDYSIKLAAIRIILECLIKVLKNVLVDITNIINSIDVDKVKLPVEDIGKLYRFLIMFNTKENVINQLLGMSIYLNNEYADKNKNHKIKNIDLINKFARYYNMDGTFKQPKLDNDEFSCLLSELKDNSFNYFKMLVELFKVIKLIEPDFFKGIDVSFNELEIGNEVNNKILKLYKELNNSILDSSKDIVLDIKVEKNDNIDRSFLLEIKKYYKNGEIVAIPYDVDAFYEVLNKSGLDKLEKQYIKRLLEEKLTNNKNILGYLKDEERIIYESATRLLDILNKSDSTFWSLKHNLEEIQIILEMFKEDISDDDREYLLNEISKLIKELSLICNKYILDDNNSKNRYIFLLDKNGVPYIYDDIDSLDISYKKAIVSLVSRIIPDNVSRFDLIHNNYNLQYRLNSFSTSKTHIAFVEIDAGIYLIIGADIIRNGYDKFSNRLKSNQLIIKQFEMLIKGLDTRNELLLEHEKYFNLLVEQKGKKVRKILKR